MTAVRGCAAHELTTGSVVRVGLRADADGWPRWAILVRDAAGVARAYLDQCQHLPVPLGGGTDDVLTDDRRRLVCRTHGAEYRLDDGYCVVGPCRGASLLPLELRELDGDLWVVDPEPLP